MKKGDVFDVQEGTIAVVVELLFEDYEDAILGVVYNTYLCYSQNRLFLAHTQTVEEDIFDENDELINYTLKESKPKISRIICDYCIIPEFDK